MRRDEDVTGWSTLVDAAEPLLTCEEVQALCTGLLPYTPREHARVYVTLTRWPILSFRFRFEPVYWADELLVSLWPAQARGFVDSVIYADPNRFIKHLSTSTIGVTL